MPQERLPRRKKPVDAKRLVDGVESVDRALSILRAFTGSDGSLSLAVLSARTGLYKSTLLRLARSLQKAGFLVRNTDGTFAVGTEPLRLAALVKRSHSLEQTVRPVLIRLTAKSGHSASFFARKGKSRLCLYRENPAAGLRDTIQEGDLLPLSRGAAGKILLCHDGSKQTAPDFRPVITRGERDPEIGAIALPVYTPDGDVFALSLSGPVYRFDETRVRQLSRTLTTAARQLSIELGALIPRQKGRN